MGSMLALGVSFLLFFIVLGLMWTIGVFILESMFIEVEKRSFEAGNSQDGNPDSSKSMALIKNYCEDNTTGGLTNAVKAYWNGSWYCTFVTLEERIKTILVWAVPILALFASIKMLVNASNRGQD